MLTYLPDYTALIQLLVGSIIVSIFFRKDFEDPLKDFREEIKHNDSIWLFFIDDYERIDSAEAKNRLIALRKSLMLVLSIYGCMILFYCASFPSEHSVQPILYNDIAFRNDLSAQKPSPLGIALLSLLVTIYQIHVIHKPSTRIQSNNPVFICGILLMFVVFAIYVIFFPDLNLDLSIFIGERWKETWELRWIIAVNYWVLFTLVLWIGFHLRLRYASTKRHYNRIVSRAKKSIYKFDVYKKTKSLIGIKERFTYILGEIEKQGNYFLRKHLIKIAKDELKIESNYYTTKFDPNVSERILIEYNPTIETSLKTLINKNAVLTKCQKRRLIRSIKKQPKIIMTNSNINSIPKEINSDVSSINKELNQLQHKLIQKLLNLGMIKKKERKE